MFSFAVRVYTEDTDLGGIVYYVNYLKFMERARTEFLRLNAVEQQLLKQQGYLFVVKNTQCDYKLPAQLDGMLDISVEVERLTAASVVFKQKVYRAEQLLCTETVEVVCVNGKSMKPCRFPNDIKNIFLDS